MFKFLVAALLSAVTSFPAFAQDEGWYFVTNSKDGNDRYSIKLRSGAHDENKQGQKMTVVVGRVTHKRENTVDLHKWYVTDADCAQEYGQFVVLDLVGSFKFETPYAKGSGTIASAIADTICTVGEATSKKAAGKGV